MKFLNLITLALVCLCTSPAFSQKVVLEDVNTRSFAGVRSVNNGEFYYTLYFGEKSGTNR